MRHQRADREAGERAKAVEIRAVPVALVGEGRVEEAVREDDRSRREGRADHVPHVLRPRGGEEEGLRLGRERDLLGMEEDIADPLGERRAPRLAGEQDLAAARTERLREPRRLGGLADSLAAFEREEEGHHRDRPCARARGSPAVICRSGRGGRARALSSASSGSRAR